MTLGDWLKVSKSIIKFHKSQFMSLSLDDSILKILQLMNESNLNLVGLINNEKT